MMYHQELPTVLQQFVEPGVIDERMLKSLIIDQGPKGEAGRLFLEDGIKWDEVREIRIEFLNILNIDYLWVMRNLVKLKLSNNIIEKIESLDILVHLKELDLSFNRIKVMQNLNHLTALEILLLHSNEISMIEGMEALQELTIFSIGNNKIIDWEHVMYLRKFKKLRSLNTSENPCTEKEGYLDYVFAFLPQLIYYQYRMITNEERHAATEKHYRVVSSLEEAEAKEKQEQDSQKEYEETLHFLTIAYVEHLDREYLFEQMFANDKEGRDLYMVTEDTQNAFEEYKKKFSVISNELYELGLKEHSRREEEMKLFNDATNDGKEETLKEGKAIANNVIRKKTEFFTNAKVLLKKLTDDIDTATLENVRQKAQTLSEEFNTMLFEAQTRLMSNETVLHEQMEDINEVFRINITDMVDSFLEGARGYFSQLRNSESEYNDTINGLILYYLSGFGDEAKIPAHLVDVCGDKDTLSNNLAASHEIHLQVIDAREDRMISRLKRWFESYTEKLVKDETERNRRQILEISHFVECQQEEFNSLKLLQQINLNATDPDILLAFED